MLTRSILMVNVPPPAQRVKKYHNAKVFAKMGGRGQQVLLTCLTGDATSAHWEVIAMTVVLAIFHLFEENNGYGSSLSQSVLLSSS